MPYLIHIAVLVSLYATLGLSLNLVVGEAGLLSVTQAAFYGIGAYVVALLLTEAHVNFFVAALAGAGAAGLAALLVGLVFSRFKGDYYALGTLGFSVIVFSIFLNWQDVTSGPLGIPGIPRPELFGLSLSSNESFLVLALVVLAVTFGICAWIRNSSFGRVLHGIREDEEAIAVFGYSTLSYKLLIFVISAMLAAIVGALFATYLSFIDPSSFSVNESIFILSIVILGGLSSNRGVMLGALFLIVLPELLRFVGFPSDVAAQMRQLVYGLALIGLMLFRPQGILGKYRL